MKRRLAYGVTFGTAIIASVLFGGPFTQAMMERAAGMHEIPNYAADPPPGNGIVIVWAILYFGTMLCAIWLPLGQPEGPKVVASVAIGMQAFTCFIAFNPEYDDHRAAALAVPGLIALVFGLWYLYHWDAERRRKEEGNS